MSGEAREPLVTQASASARYIAAAKKLEPFIKPTDDGGALELTITSGEQLGIDADIFAELRLSLERTNHMLRDQITDARVARGAAVLLGDYFLDGLGLGEGYAERFTRRVLLAALR